MVFESLVVDLVNRFLGDYIDNLDKSQLSLGLWGGDVVLNNLYVKENLLDEFDLPVKVILGNLGQLKLKIPWKNLYNEPTIAQLDGLYVLAVPNTSVRYNEEKEEQAQWSAKVKELERIEEAKKKSEEKNVTKVAEKDSFAEKLFTNVVKNLELTITNIHVRYEDTVTNTACPFSVGVTLHELSCRTSDENWSINSLKDAVANVIFKLLRMDSLAVYWNCGLESYADRPKSAMQQCLKDNVATGTHKPNYHYLMEPLASVAQLRLNMKPERDNFTIPKILADVVFEEIVIVLGKNQYQLLMELVESLERMRRADQYRRYRTVLSVQQNNRLWWKFAYTCVLEETVRRQHKMWSWQRMKAHRQLCMQYKDLYKTKLLSTKHSADLLTDVERCEKQLDVFNITLMRQQAEIAAKREGIKKKEEQSGGGWFSGWFRHGTQATTEKQTVEEKVQEILTADERQKLYDAIGYEENMDSDYPKEFVAVRLCLLLRSLQLKLKDTSLQQAAITNVSLKGLSADVSQRPSAKSISVQTIMDSFQLFGAAASEAAPLPVIASSFGRLVGSGDSDKFVTFLFETNPLDHRCDTRIVMTAKPLEVIYDARTIILLADFFRPPETVYMVQLQAAAAAKLDEVRRQTAARLQSTLRRHKTTDISICLQPACIIVPDRGIYTPDCRMIVLDLGELNVQTDQQSHLPTDSDDLSSDLSLDDLRDRAFNKFKMSLKSVQILFASTGENWVAARRLPQSSLHLLNPLAVNVDVFQCMVEDAELPRLKVFGELPTLSIGLTDQRVTEILQILVSIPLPEGYSDEDVDEFAKSLKAPAAKLMPIREDVEELLGIEELQKPEQEKVESEYVNAKEIELSFEIKQICLTLSQFQDGVDTPMLKVTVDSVGTQLTLRSFDLCIDAFVGAVCLQHLEFSPSNEVVTWLSKHGATAVSDGITLINVPSDGAETSRLLTVRLLKAQRRHPEFTTVYENTLQHISAEFSMLQVLLHEDAVASLIAVLETFNAAVEKSKVTSEEVGKTRKRHFSSTLSLSSVSSLVSKPARSTARVRSKTDIVQVSVVAKLNSVLVAICNSDRLLADIQVSGLNVNVALRRHQTSIAASLHDICVRDHVIDAVYPKVLSFDGDKVFNADITLFDNATTGKNYLDMNCVDALLRLQTGCMKVIFLNRFVQDLLRFVNRFEAAKVKLREASAAVADGAVLAAQQLSTRAFRVSLDIHLKAPIIIIPRSSMSRHVLVVDLGRLTVSNCFKTVDNDEDAKTSDGLPAVIDHMTVDLTDMKLSTYMMVDSEMSAECQLLKPVCLRVTVARNLSASWYHGCADIELCGQLQEISLLVSQGDIQTLFGILNENLREGVPKENEIITASGDQPTVDTVASSRKLSRLVSAGPSSPVDNIYTKFKLNFAIDSIQMELFTGDRDADAGSGDSSIVESLAKLQLKKFVTAVDIKSDSSLTVDVSLGSCELDDTRPSCHTEITRMIKHASASDETEHSNMIQLVFSQDTSSNRDVEMTMTGLHVVVCVEYLLQLAQFFIQGMSVIPERSSTTTPPEVLSSTTEQTESSLPSDNGELRVLMMLMKPEIILVEDATKLKSEALVMTMQVQLIVRQSSTQQMLQGSIRQLSLASCEYLAETQTSTVKSQLLLPLDIDVHSTAPQSTNHHVEVYVSDIVMNVTASSVRTLMATLTSLTTTKEVEEDDELLKIPKNLWSVKKIEECNFWFLKSESGTSLYKKELEAETATERDEQLLLSKCHIVVTLSGSVNGRTIPFLLTRMMLKNVDVRNWSTMLNVTCELSVKVAYYNDQLAVWELIVEPVEVEGKHRPWEIFLKLQKNDLLSIDDDDLEVGSFPPPQMTIDIASIDVLQITITKTSLEVFSNLAQSFGDAYRLMDIAGIEAANLPFIVKNETGMHISVKPDDSFEIPKTADVDSLPLLHGDSVSLHLKASSTVGKSSTSDFFFNDDIEEKTKKLQLMVADLASVRDINVTRAETRIFACDRRSFPGGVWHIVSQISASHGCKLLTLRSVLQVHNCLPFAVDVSYTLAADADGHCGVVQPGSVVNLPCDAVYTAPYEIHFTPCIDGTADSSCVCRWKSIAAGETVILECTSRQNEAALIFFAAKMAVDDVLFESTTETSAKCYTLSLSPAVVLRNLLPLTVVCHCKGSQCTVEAGNQMPLLNAACGCTSLSFTMMYQSRQWCGQYVIVTRPDVFGVCHVEAEDGSEKVAMDLGVHCELCDGGYWQLSLFSPYWMINRTQRDLTYRSSEDHVVQHSAADNDSIILFTLKSYKTSSSKSMVSLKVGLSEWSDRFSLDTVGSIGTVQCKLKDQTVTVGVKITLGSSSLTKIVTFTPYYVLINQAKFGIECRENVPVAEWCEIPPGSCVPFWPTLSGSSKQVVASIAGTSLESQPFDITETHATFLKIYHEYGGVNVECTVSEGVVRVVFQHYCHGLAAALLVNHTTGTMVEYCQKYVWEKHLLESGSVVLYTWQNPAGPRELVWSCGEAKDNRNTLDQDGIGDFFADTDTKLYWVSFLDGMQRVLLFTDDITVATVAQQAGELERVEKEVNINLQGVGLSLVNNILHEEIAYMSISSSGVIWEHKKRKRYKSVTMLMNQLLEEGYQRYLTELELARGDQIDGRRFLSEGKVEVDYASEPVMLLKPKKVVIRRSFHHGICLQHRTSAHQTQLHVMLHRLQLDSQLAGAVFSTVLAPVPPPKTVAAESAPKPFAEMSVMIRNSEHSDINQFKYCKLLVQEFSVKVDQGFLVAVLSMFEMSAADEESRRLVAFQRDCEVVDQSLMDSMVHTTAGTAKNFYDMLHFSPLKMHLSFSLYGADKAETGDKKPQIQWHVLNLFLQSIGIVLTDVQDVIFKLGYFERKHKFYDQKQLLSEITGHYSQQAIRQMYVLVLGLDVLGNPFGVIRGLATGIEDLFYEPYQGAIQGPEEFAEGLALGVRSLLGHAVGGAAGAVSRITGALGKGIATLTLDDAYQKQRREALNRRPADLKEGLARGGKGLVMGVFHGVTGIVTQPVEGAKQEGVSGFFKGVGKGLVGVVTRPASGVVDFASSSFEGIRRLSEMGDEVRRVRPSRFLHPDGIVRPFVYHDSEGNQILQDLKSGFGLEHYIGHLMSTDDGRNAVIATNKRVIFTCKGDILGHWDLEWSYLWEQLREPPTLTAKGISFILKEKQRRLIGGPSSGKMVYISEKNRHQTQRFLQKMQHAMQASVTK